MFGVIAVTHAMLPLLRRSAAARIVNMSSELGSLTHLADPSSPWSANLLLDPPPLLHLEERAERDHRALRQ